MKFSVFAVFALVALGHGMQLVNITLFKRIDRGRRSEGSVSLEIGFSTNESQRVVKVESLVLKPRVLSLSTAEANNVVESRAFSDSRSLFVDGANVQLGSIFLNEHEILEFEFVMQPHSVSAVILNASNVPLPFGSCGVDDYAFPHLNSSRHRRLYTDVGDRDFDQWYGNDNCYPGDDELHQTDLAIAVGYFAFKRWGNSSQTVADHVTYLMHKVNEVFSRQTNFFFKVELLQVSTRYRQYRYDAESDDNFTCTTHIYTQLHQLLLYSLKDVETTYTFWHLIENCDLPVAYRNISEERTIGVAHEYYPPDEYACIGQSKCGVSMILSPFFKDLDDGTIESFTYEDRTITWVTLAHELGHSLGLRHPWEFNGLNKTKTGGIMDYGVHAPRIPQENSDSVLVSFKASSSRDTLCETLTLYKTDCPEKLKSTTELASNCGNLRLDDPTEECECADGSQGCWRCTDCKWDSGFNCSNETLFYEACRCNDETGLRVECQGTCIADGSCLYDGSLCTSLLFGSVPCYSFPGNPCKVVCTDPRTEPPSCMVEHFLDEDAPCYLHNQWGTCSRNDELAGYERTCNVTVLDGMTTATSTTLTNSKTTTVSQVSTATSSTTTSSTTSSSTTSSSTTMTNSKTTTVEVSTATSSTTTSSTTTSSTRSSLNHTFSSSTPVSVSVKTFDDGSRKYLFDNILPDSGLSFIVTKGTYTFEGIPSEHPLNFFAVPADAISFEYFDSNRTARLDIHKAFDSLEYNCTRHPNMQFNNVFRFEIETSTTSTARGTQPKQAVRLEIIVGAASAGFVVVVCVVLCCCCRQKSKPKGRYQELIKL